MSQENAVYTSATFSDGRSPRVNARPVRAEKPDGNSALSTIHFDAPMLATMREDRDPENNKRKGELAVV